MLEPNPKVTVQQGRLYFEVAWVTVRLHINGLWTRNTKQFRDNSCVCQPDTTTLLAETSRTVPALPRLF